MSRPKRLTAAGRVAVAVVAVLSLGVLIVVGVAYAGMINRLSADLDDTLFNEVEAYTAAVAPRIEFDERSLDEASRSYLGARNGSGGLDLILIVRFADGRIMSNSDVKLEDAPYNDVLLDPSRAVSGFADVTYRGTSYRTITSPIVNPEDEVLAVFQASAATAELTRIARELAISLLFAGAAVVLLGTLLSAWIARTSLEPLRAMADTASQVTQTSLAERIGYVGPDDELGALANALDSMLDRIEEAFAEQRRFVGDASHELRTPVAVIRGNIDLLKDENFGPVERVEALRIIDEEVARMQRLLVDLLSLAGSGSSTRRPFQPLQVGPLLAETAARARSIGKRRFEVTCEGEQWISGDPDLLEQALGNIARNAVEHTPEGGLITLTCRPEGDHARIEITDSGPGIDPKDLPRIFDRFYRAGGPRSSETGGSGLGLAIARRLLWLHSAIIEADNAPGGGARFTVLIPTIEPPE